MNDMTETIHLAAPQLALSQALRIADIHPSPTNPRKTFPEAEQAELIASVKRHGVMQPILVRPWPAAYTYEGEQPKYELIAGERRYRAAKAAGLEFISGTVRDLDDHETLELQIVENLHRKDLNELEEAEGYELMTKQYGYTAEQLAAKIDKSKAYIYARLKLTALCEKAREAFRNGLLDASRALLIARIPLAALQDRATKEITESYGGPWTYRQAATWIQNNYMLKLTEAPFPRADESLVAGAGKCHPCPKRTGSNPELYPDVKSADICTDPECYATKKAAWIAQQKSEAEASGKTVILGDDARKIMPYGPNSDLQHYVVLDRENYEAPKIDGATPTNRQLLAEAKIDTFLVEDHRSGKLIEVAKRSEVKKAMVAAGITTPTTQSEREREAEARAKEEGDFRRRLHRQVRAAFATDISEHDAVLDEDDMRLIARQFWGCTWQENQKRLATIWIESEEKLDEHERMRMLSERINTMPPAELCLLLIDLALVGQTLVNTYSRESNPTHLLDMAKRLNVSPDTIRREMQVEKEEKAAKKKGKGAKAPAPAAEAEQPETANTATTKFNTGDTVRIRHELAQDGIPHKFAGREGTVMDSEDGTIDHIVMVDGQYTFITPGNLELLKAAKLATGSTIKEGDRVRIKEGLKGPGGHFRKCCGREGTVTAIAQDGELMIDTGPGTELAYCIPDEVDLLPQFKAGDRVLVSPNANTKGFKLVGAGQEGVVAQLDLEHGEAVISIDGDKTLRGIPLEFVELAAPIAQSAEAEAEQSEPETPAVVRTKRTGQPEVLYTHPDNTDLTWSGRGRKPKWVEAWLDQGTLEQLLTTKRPTHKPKASKAVATSAACDIAPPRCDKTLELQGLDVAQPHPAAP